MRRATLLLLLLGLIPSPGSTAGVTIKLASLVPERSVWGIPLAQMAEDWREKTDGRVTLRIYPDGIAGDDPDMVRKMRIGQLQAAALTTAGLTEIDPAFAVFEIPLFFASYEEFFYVLEKLSPVLEERLESKGFILLHWGHAGWIYLFSTRPVATVDDLRELKLFVWAGNDRMVQWWKDNDFRPVPLAATDIMSGLQTGMIEALPSTPLAALSLQWFRSTSYMLDIQIAPLTGASIVTERAWDKIAPADREILLASARRAGERFREEIPAEDRKAIAEMEKRGLTVTRVAGTEGEAAWREGAREMAAGVREAFVPREILELARRERDRFREQGR